MRGSKSAGYRWFGLSFLAIALFTALRSPAQSAPDIAANEATAIAILREIAAAQARVKADVTIDTNCDGVGEYGYLAELAGTKPKRVCNGGMPQEGNSTMDLIHPPLIRPALGEMGYSSPLVAGYRFEMWLPAATFTMGPYTGEVWGIPEDFSGGKEAASYPGSRNGSGLWCCYAWPDRAGVTGNRAFFINQKGELLQCANDGPSPFSGVDLSILQLDRPHYGEALVNSRDMSSAMRLGIPGGANNTIWARVW
jgi:hypothetical protein